MSPRHKADTMFASKNTSPSTLPAMQGVKSNTPVLKNSLEPTLRQPPMRHNLRSKTSLEMKMAEARERSESPEANSEPKTRP